MAKRTAIREGRKARVKRGNDGTSANKSTTISGTVSRLSPIHADVELTRRIRFEVYLWGTDAAADQIISSTDNDFGPKIMLATGWRRSAMYIDFSIDDNAVIKTFMAQVLRIDMDKAKIYNYQYRILNTTLYLDKHPTSIVPTSAIYQVRCLDGKSQSRGVRIQYHPVDFGYGKLANMDTPWRYLWRSKEDEDEFTGYQWNAVINTDRVIDDALFAIPYIPVATVDFVCQLKTLMWSGAKPTNSDRYAHTLRNPVTHVKPSVRRSTDYRKILRLFSIR